MPTDFEDVLTGVGGRLQAARRERSATLAGVAAATGISASTLSRLENGRLRPTLEQLLPLARFYGVPLDELVGAAQTGDPRVHLRPVRRNGRTFLPLSNRAGGIQAYKMILPARQRPDRPATRQHEGFEWLYVLDGRVRLVLGTQDLELGPGEAAEFDTRVPHWIGNATERAAELLILFGQQGERVHLAARTR